MGQNLIKKLDSPSHCVQSFLNFADQFQILILEGLGNMKKKCNSVYRTKIFSITYFFSGRFYANHPYIYIVKLILSFHLISKYEINYFLMFYITRMIVTFFIAFELVFHLKKLLWNKGIISRFSS